MTYATIYQFCTAPLSYGWPRFRCLTLCAMALANGGCLGAAQVELSAASALQAVASELRQTVEEYHGDLARSDDQREQAAIQAFIKRTSQVDVENSELNTDGALLSQALAKIRADRLMAMHRYMVSLDNIEIINETAQGLTQHGLKRLLLGQNISGLLKIKD